jgi:hypothetical protein
MEPLFGFHPYPTYVAEGGQSAMEPDAVSADTYGQIDNSPRYVGAIVLGSLLTLVALKALGFRFSFGVSAGR